MYSQNFKNSLRKAVNHMFIYLFFHVEEKLINKDKRKNGICGIEYFRFHHHNLKV